ncbi:MAG: hypothetical protein ACYTG2_12490 [Planctomycetota bacterium]|jgi:hypothetical protein
MSPRPLARVALGVLVVAACAAPHLVRFLGDTVVLQDGFYAHAAFMLSHGHAPYVDFVLPAFPLAEGVLALLFGVFGHGAHVAEAATLAIVAAVACVLAVAARRLAGAWPARAEAVAALAWCGSLWVLHFHLFERETWAALGTALALLAAAGPAGSSARDEPSSGRCAAIAGALALAFFVKITAVAAAAGILAHLAITGRRRAFVRVAGLFLLIIGAATALGAWAWGRPFLTQVGLFGFFRSPEAGSVGERAQQLLLWADPSMLLGLAALCACGLPRLARREGAAALVLTAQLGFALLVNSTLWEHNLIDFAPAGALLLGVAADRWARCRVGLVAAAGALTVAITVVDGTWLGGDYGPRGAGFGGWPRESLQRRAAFLQEWSDPDDVVLTTNPWWSFEAGRVEFVRYWDLEPQLRGLEASLAADGLIETFGKRHGPLLLGPGRPEPDPRARALEPYSGRSVANALVYVRPRLLEALDAGTIALVVEPLPPAVLLREDLVRAGYVRFTDHDLGQAGWRPPAR